MLGVFMLHKEVKEPVHGHEARSLENLFSEFESQQKHTLAERKKKANVRHSFKHWKELKNNNFMKVAFFALFYSKEFHENPEKTIQTILKINKLYSIWKPDAASVGSDARTLYEGIPLFLKNKKEADLKIELLKVYIIMGTFYRYSFLTNFYRNYYPDVLKKLTDAERLALAKVDLAYHGFSALNKYNFSETELESFRNYARDSVKKYVIHVPAELIEKYVQTKNVEGLRYLMFQRFSGKFYSTALSDSSCMKKLNDLIRCSDGSNLQEIANVFKQAMQEQENYIIETGWRKMQSSTDARRYHWGANFGKKPDEQFNISHGGGYFNILEFLLGSYEGYQLEPNSYYNAVGLQVSPNVSPPGGHRDDWYASRAADPRKCFFDSPARLFATTRAKYLDRADDDHDYEAGLRSEFIDKLHNVKVTKF